jgi:hypothetical protein
MGLHRRPGREVEGASGAALGACRALFPRLFRDNTAKVNAWLRAALEHFHEAVEDRVQQGAASMLAAVHS